MNILDSIKKFDCDNCIYRLQCLTNPHKEQVADTSVEPHIVIWVCRQYTPLKKT